MKNVNQELKLMMLKTAFHANSSKTHIGSCLSCFEIIFQILMVEKKEKDYFILSKGHAALAWYTVLAYQKKIPAKAYKNYLTNGGVLGIHPSSGFSKDIPLATGSLGHGLSFACGLAKASQLKRNKSKVFCLISDGECNEGSVWEAALFASSQKLNNLITIIDKNNIQAFGRVSEALGEAAAKDKWKAFGFNIFECDGHNLSRLHKVFNKAIKSKNSKPNLIICHTKRGNGIAEIEDKVCSNYFLITNKEIQAYEKKIG